MKTNVKWQDQWIDTTVNPMYCRFTYASSYGVAYNYYDASVGSWVCCQTSPARSIAVAGLPSRFNSPLYGYFVNIGGQRTFANNPIGISTSDNTPASVCLWYSGANPIDRGHLYGYTVEENTWYLTSLPGMVGIYPALIGTPPYWNPPLPWPPDPMYYPYFQYKLAGSSPIGEFTKVAKPTPSWPDTLTTSWTTFVGWTCADRLGKYVATGGATPANLYVGFIRFKDTISGRLFYQKPVNSLLGSQSAIPQYPSYQDGLRTNGNVKYTAWSDDGYLLYATVMSGHNKYVISKLLNNGQPRWEASGYDAVETTYSLVYTGQGKQPDQTTMNIVIDGYESLDEPQWSMPLVNEFGGYNLTVNMPITFNIPMVK